MVGGLDFKSMHANGSGIWINLREINYLIRKGIIRVDKEALLEYADTPDPEYSAIMEINSTENSVQDLLGREINDTDRHFIEAAKKAMIE